MGKSVMFTGHRTLPEKAVARQLHEIIPVLYANGFNNFITGGALGFDTLAALAVLEFGKHHPHVHLCLALPAEDQPADWDEKDRRRYYDIFNKSATHQFLCGSIKEKDVYRVRNYFMVDHADACIAYLDHGGRSGTVMTVNYAKRKGLPLLNIAVPGYDIDAFVRSL